MNRFILKMMLGTSLALVAAGAASAGIYPGDGCGCIHPCLPIFR